MISSSANFGRKSAAGVRLHHGRICNKAECSQPNRDLGLHRRGYTGTDSAAAHCTRILHTKRELAGRHESVFSLAAHPSWNPRPSIRAPASKSVGNAALAIQPPMRRSLAPYPMRPSPPLAAPVASAHRSALREPLSSLDAAALAVQGGSLFAPLGSGRACGRPASRGVAAVVTARSHVVRGAAAAASAAAGGWGGGGGHATERAVHGGAAPDHAAAAAPQRVPPHRPGSPPPPPAAPSPTSLPAVGPWPFGPPGVSSRFPPPSPALTLASLK